MGKREFILQIKPSLFYITHNVMEVSKVDSQTPLKHEEK